MIFEILLIKKNFFHAIKPTGIPTGGLKTSILHKSIITHRISDGGSLKAGEGPLMPTLYLAYA